MLALVADSYTSPPSITSPENQFMSPENIGYRRRRNECLSLGERKRGVCVNVFVLCLGLVIV